MTIAKPTQVATPFANSGLKNSIPQSATGSNLASLEEGFPAVTMAAVADGGTPPQGQDFNGILNQVTNQLRYSQAGGLYPYDATFCTAIGGYPLGAILMSADGSKLWQNQVAGNTNNPDSDDTNWTELCTVDTLTAGLASKADASVLNGYLPLLGGTMTGGVSFNGTPDAGDNVTFFTQPSNDRRVYLWGGTQNASGVLALCGAGFIAEGGSYAWEGAAVLGACDANGNIKWFRPEISGQLAFNNITIARYCLPSTTYRNLTLPSSGGSVTAPDDGWIQLSKSATAAGQYIYMHSPSLGARDWSVGSNTLDIYIPVCKGDSVQVNYSAAGTTSRFRFYYANGSAWAAS